MVCKILKKKTVQCKENYILTVHVNMKSLGLHFES